MYDIIWSDKAVSNLKSIENYIAEESPIQAKKVINEIINYVEELFQFPHMGGVVPELNDCKLRQLIKYSYRIIYSVNKNQINIITIIHSKQDFTQRFRND
ncbi:MAG: type II toxin-antitoxin system RelE/ParE family toxin [Sedimentibacter sp.]